jgi:CHRD domain
MRVRAMLIAAALAAVIAVAVVGVVGAGAQSSGSKSKALFAVLSGKKEISPTTGEKGAGDPDGRGTFSGMFDGNQLCFGITVKNISTPIAAHIHRGSPRQNGPIVVTLVHPASGDPGASSGCTAVEGSLAQAIQRNPRRYYVNVHTGDFQGGAVRGQLFGRRR